MSELTLKLDKIRCGGCVARAEREFSAAEGIDTAEVNLATKECRFVFDQRHNLSTLVSLASSVGYPAVTDEIVLNVPALNTENLSLIEQRLMDIDGVDKAIADPIERRVYLSVYGGVFQLDMALQRLKRFGYEVQLDRAEGDESREAQADIVLGQRLKWALILTTPLFVAVMATHFIPGAMQAISGLIPMGVFVSIQAVLALLVAVGPGRAFFVEGWSALRHGAPDMNSLVMLGSGAALVFSLAQLLLPAGDLHNVYFESAAVIISLILLGRFLEARAKHRTGDAVRALLSRGAKTALRRNGDDFERVAVADIQVDDVLKLQAGETVAVDGIVIDGASDVDESMLTGEPIPVVKTPDQPLYAGTVNQDGSLTYRATGVGADTAIAKIAKLVQRAQATRLPIQNLVNRITLWFVPVILGIAVLTALVWLALGGTVAQALVAAVSVLIIACPCAMGLATPTSIIVGVGRAAQRGVLFKKGDALQALSSVRAVVFDKTGTLTKGQPEFVGALSSNIDQDQLLSLAASVEQHSAHPLATAILAAYPHTPAESTQFKTYRGAGAEAMVDGQLVRVGNLAWFESLGIEFEASVLDFARQSADDGCSLAYVGADDRALGVIALRDQVRPQGKSLVESLQAQSIEVVMLTGDNARSARGIANALEISVVHSDATPSSKVDTIEQLKAQYGTVAFVGDGINDAAALTAASVGMAMSQGSDIAIESADVVLLNQRLDAVLSAIDMSRKTLRNIRQNLFWAFAYNVALIPVAAGVFYAWTSMQLSPMLASLAMALSSVLVVSNALRLRRA